MRAAHLDRPRLLQRHQRVPARRRAGTERRAGRHPAAARARRYRDWRVATTLRCRARAARRRYGFGTLRARRLRRADRPSGGDGRLRARRLRAHGGCRTRSSITGRHRRRTSTRLARDLKRVCERRSRLFEPRAGARRCERYVFMTMAVGDGYGGLEHRASTALICSRARPAVAGHERRDDEGYRTFLGLVQPRVFPHLERQAHQAGGVRALRPAAGELHALLWLVRRLHPLLRRPDAGARRPDRRKRPTARCSARRSTRVLRGSGRHQAERGRIELRRLDQVLPPGRELRRTPSSATTPRARWSRCAST